jgi:glycosyltransferase involved in cell wall biosynthesis
MKVGIDVTPIIYGRGVSRYTSNLTRALLQYTNLDITAFGYSWGQWSSLQKQVKGWQKQFPRLHTHLRKLPPTAIRHLWRWGLQPIATQVPSLDVFHSWDWQQPPDTQLPIVSTIHDLAILKYPDTAHPRVVAAHQKSWHQLKKSRAHIIAVSHTTAHDIREYLEIPQERIHVVYEALPSEFEASARDLSEVQEAKAIAKFGLNNKPYLLFVGTQEPRKNLARTIKAWQPLAKEVDLLIAGASGWDTSLEKISGAQPTFLGSVSDQELIVLYAEAEALVYTCLDEGFGLPILEAFALGTSVVTSDRSSMKEVAGNAAIQVDPSSVESIRSGLKQVLGESTSQQQTRLQKMIIRLHQFSWKTAARATADVYRKAYETAR